MAASAHSETPWQRVFRKFGIENRAEFARLFGWHRSKVSRALRDPDGLIHGRDQKKIQKVAKERGVTISSGDMVPANG